VPGGSSSGSAAAVGAGEADVAYGTDTGGSIRIPAACCGVAGLKTTFGRVPVEGVRPLAPSLDTVGPMARDVKGLVAGMALLEPGFTSASAEDAPRTVGRLAIDADPVISDAIDAALRAAGFAVQPVTIPGLAAFIEASITLLGAETWASNGQLVTTAPGRIGDDVRDRLLASSKIGPERLSQARQEIAHLQTTLDGCWDRIDVLAAPTLLGFPPLLEDAPDMHRIRGLNSMVNAAGLPALALPVPADGPLPASIQLIGPAASEDRLLAAGAVLEQALS